MYFLFVAWLIDYCALIMHNVLLALMSHLVLPGLKWSGVQRPTKP